MEGVVKKVLVDRDFGFIEPKEFGDDVFFHRSQLPATMTFDEQLLFRRVRFDMTTTASGKNAAENIRPLE